MSAGLTSFSDLVLRAQRGVDYELIVCERDAAATVLALHGGYIEPLTEQLALAIADEHWNLYALYGLHPGAATLRLPTLRLSEMRCDGLLAHSALALAVTGCSEGEVALVGGRNERLVQALHAQLQAAGLPVAETAAPEAERLAIQCYNRTRLGGAQLALPLALRRRLTPMALAALRPGEPAPFTDLGQALIAAVQAALQDCVRELHADLAMTLERFERATRAVQATGLLGPKRDGAESTH